MPLGMPCRACHPVLHAIGPEIRHDPSTAFPAARMSFLEGDVDGDTGSCHRSLEEFVAGIP